MTDQTATLVFIGVIMFIFGFIAGMYFDASDEEDK